MENRIEESIDYSQKVGRTESRLEGKHRQTQSELLDEFQLLKSSKTAREHYGRMQQNRVGYNKQPFLCAKVTLQMK